MIISINSEPAKILRAAAFAAAMHSQQKRKDKAGAPYINHPIGVAEILTRVAGVTDTEVIQAALLHDTLEDTNATREELDSMFGPRVGSIVAEVTDDTALPKPERKQLQVQNAPGLSREARLIRIADKIYNCSEIAADCPSNWSLERKLEYLAWAESVVNRIRGTHAQLEGLFEKTVKEHRMSLTTNQS